MSIPVRVRLKKDMFDYIYELLYYLPRKLLHCHSRFQLANAPETHKLLLNMILRVYIFPQQQLRMQFGHHF